MPKRLTDNEWVHREAKRIVVEFGLAISKEYPNDQRIIENFLLRAIQRGREQEQEQILADDCREKDTRIALLEKVAEGVRDMIHPPQPYRDYHRICECIVCVKLRSILHILSSPY